MKKFTMLTTLLPVFFLFAMSVNAQSNGQANLLSQKIAKRMQDSLGLTPQQRNHVFEVNMNLHNQKQLVRLNTVTQDSLRARLQRVENTRDSLYLPIIGINKYPIYLQKKRNLVNNT